MKDLFYQLLKFPTKLGLQEKLTSHFGSGFLVVLASWGMYFAFLWPQMFFSDGMSIQAGWVGVWGDWAAHVTYANVFALRPVELWLSTHPIHVHSQFTYPFLADALSGLLMRGGLNLIDAFVLPSIVTTIFFLLVLYTFYFYVLKRQASAAVVGVTLFLLNGGLGFYWFIKDWLTSPNLEQLAYPPSELTHSSQQAIEWVSIVTSEMIPQRAFLLGFPLTMLIMLQLYRWWKTEFATTSWPRVLLLGWLSGWLFFVHAHSFLALFFIAGVLSLSRWRQWRYWLGYALATGSIALPIALSLHTGHLGSFFRWTPGWFAHPDHHGINWFYFWWVNYGLFLPLAGWGTWRYRLYRHPLVMSGWVIFAAVNLIQFQPHLWDNTKLLTWAHVLLVVPVWFSLDGIWRWRKWIGKVIAIILFVVLTLSSWFDVWRLTRVDRNAYPMWSHVDLQRAATVNALTQPGERVLAAQNHNHWVVAHTHLQTLMGFPGWLWTYGVTDSQLAGDITTMFQGGAAAESLLDFYDVKYVVIGNPERNDLKANQAWFEDHHDILLQDEEYTVYQTSSEYWSEPSAPAEE